jgi:hypothetical protein
VGHNSGAQPSPAKHSFQDNADELIRVGRLITSFRRIGLAIRDRRCHRDHLLVLYAIMEKLNEQTGTAFPSRRAIAEQEGLTDRAVENVLYELRLWGYVDWDRRAEPHLHRGRLLHYTLPVLTWTEEELTRAILAHRETLKGRSTPPRVYISQGVHLPGSTPQGVPKSTSPEVTRNLLREPAKKISGADAPVGATLPFEEPDRPPDDRPKRKAKATEEQFGRFWAAYPIREGKAAALKNFLKLTYAEAELAIFGASQYAAKIAAERERLAKRGEEPRIKHAQGWLTARRFEDHEEAYVAANGAASDDPEAEVERYVASPDGQSVIREKGPVEGRRIIRDIVLGRPS